MADSLAYQISLTLGDHADDYNIDGIADGLADAVGHRPESVDEIDSEQYWAIVRAHEMTGR